MKSTNSALYRHFIRGLREQRKAGELSQLQLADRLKVGQSAVSKIERGERRIDIAEFVEIAQAIGANPAQLFAKLLLAYAESPKPARKRLSRVRRS